jgi:hypothetical protein
MARKKAIMASVIASKLPAPGKLNRALIPSRTTDKDIAVEAIAKLMYSGQWDNDSRDATLKELGCANTAMSNYEKEAQRLVRMSMKHSGKAFERLSGVLNEIIDRTMDERDHRTAVMAIGKLADITGLNKQVIEHREGDRLEEFRRRALSGEDPELLAREATDFLLGVESGLMYQ